MIGSSHTTARRLLRVEDMASIEINKPHQLGRVEAHRRIEALETQLQEKYGVTLEWDGDRANVSGSGVSGELAVDDAEIWLRLKLGLALLPVQGKIRSTLDQQLERALA
jgi:putative polyhydroxyalkanoate system protein